MKKIIFLFLLACLLFPNSVFSFTVDETSQVSGEYVCFKRMFLNDNVFPTQLSWVTIRIDIEAPRSVSNFNDKNKIRNVVDKFLLVMNENSWFINRDRLVQPDIPDGFLTFRADYSPKFFISLNGKKKGIYYNSDKMTLRNYFAVVNKKILRRLSNAGYLSPSNHDVNNSPRHSGKRRVIQ